MGDKALSTFQSDLTLALGNVENITAYSAQWVNAAYADFCTRDTFPGLRAGIRFNFPELDRIDTSKATADGVKYITIPTGLLQTYTIKDTTSDRKLSKISVREYADKRSMSDTTAEGAPTEYCRMSDKFYFHPVPDATYALEIYYRKRPSAMVNATDVTEVDAMWDETILELAVIQSMRRLRFPDADIEVKNKAWQEIVAAKVGILGDEEKDFHHVITPDYAYKILGRR